MNAPLSMQTAIVNAARASARRYLERELFFLLWRKSRVFDFNSADERELKAVVDAIQEGEEVPLLQEMEEEVCRFGNYQNNRCDDIFSGRTIPPFDHTDSCRVQAFRKAIEE